MPTKEQCGYGHELRAAVTDPTLYSMKFVLPLSATAAAGGSRRSPGPRLPPADSALLALANGAQPAQPSARQIKRQKQLAAAKANAHVKGKGKDKNAKGEHPKGKGKGKKGKGKDPKQQMLALTDLPAAGAGTCHRFNSKRGCTYTTNCRFVHACAKCGGNHPALKCRSA